MYKQEMFSFFHAIEPLLVCAFQQQTLLFNDCYFYYS